MMWLFAVLVVLVMGGVAAVAAGRGGSLPEEFDDRPDVRVPAGPLTGDDLRSVRFSLGVRGYRMSEVDTLLARLADQLDERRDHGGAASTGEVESPGGDGEVRGPGGSA